MASCPNATHSDAKRLEQIIAHFYTKSLTIILESRSPCTSSHDFSGKRTLSSLSSSSSSSRVRPRDKWFNLALGECIDVVENLDPWRLRNFEPMVVDIILVQRPLRWDSVSPRRDLLTNLSMKESSPFFWEDFRFEAKSEKVIERWIVQYENRKPRDSGSGSGRSSNTLRALYKKSILLLRSLYVTLRLFPAYKIFQDLNSSSQIYSFTLDHKVSFFLEPLACKEEAEMQRFGFTPVDTPCGCGRLCLSVLYQSSLSVSPEPATPLSPLFIPNYVGSSLADPLKRFSSLSVYPLSLPFSRRHNQSYDGGKALSPSPTYSEIQASKIAEAEKSASTAGTCGAVEKISFSRTPSRSFLGDPEFRCPFDLKDDDMTDPGARPEPFDKKDQLYDPLDPWGFFRMRKPEGAAVCPLVPMSKKSPLHQNSCTSVHWSQVSEPENWINNAQEANQISDTHTCHHAASSSVTFSRPVSSIADALQELRVYGELNNFLLSQGGRYLTSATSSSSSLEPSTRRTT